MIPLRAPPVASCELFFFECRRAQYTPMDSSITVAPIEKTILQPDFRGCPFAAELSAMLPKYGPTTIAAETIISGINTAVANGIRRVLLNESSNYAMAVDLDTFKTDDAYILHDMIAKRVALIAVDQTVVAQAPEKFEFKLAAENATDAPMKVYSASIIPFRDGKAMNGYPFNETFEVFELQAHCRISFAAKLKLDNGVNDAAHATASMAVTIPLDQRPIDQNDPSYREKHLPLNAQAKYVKSCSVSDPRVFLLRFEICGRGTPESVLRKACDSLIERLTVLKSAEITKFDENSVSAAAAAGAGSAEFAGDGAVYLIRALGESATLGTVFMKCCDETSPDIGGVTHSVEDRNNELHIRLRTSADPAKIVERAADYAIGMYSAIKRHIK